MSDMPQEKRFSLSEMEAYVEAQVAKRLAEVEQSQMLAEMRERLDRIERKVEEGNHVKEKLAQLDRKVIQHIRDPLHKGGEELIFEFQNWMEAHDAAHTQSQRAFGIDGLSAEEKAIVAPLLKREARHAEEAPVQEKRSKNSREVLALIVAVAAAALSGVGTLLNLIKTAGGTPHITP